MEHELHIQELKLDYKRKVTRIYTGYSTNAFYTGGGKNAPLSKF